MSFPSVVQSHVFGLDQDVNNNICFLDEQTVLYPAGTQLVSYDIEHKAQRFINVNDGDGITALAVNSSASLIAVAVRGGSASTPHSRGADDVRAGKPTGIPTDGTARPSLMGRDTGTAPGRTVGTAANLESEAAILLYDLQNGRKKKALFAGEASAREYISVAFSPDGKHIIALTGGSDWNLYIWDWDKAKIRGVARSINTANTEIHQMSVNQFDPTYTQVCVTGNALIRTFRHAEGSWKPLLQHKSEKNLLCHAYISENRIVVGTEDSKLLVYETGELILEMAYCPPSAITQYHLTPPALTDITVFPNGVLVGTSAGACVLFERTDDANLFKRSKEYQLDEGAAVACIAMNPAEDSAVVTLKNSQIYMIPLDAEVGKNETVKCSPLSTSFHNGAITGMDAAARKPVIATCGLDRSIRIWNYLDNTLEVMKYFTDEPQSISLHPSGLYVLVGFSDGLKLMNVLVDDIRQYWEAPIRGCRECHFSNGGQFFAAVHGSTIIIYNSWTLEIVAHLKGHQVKIRSITWSVDDSRMVSCGLDGTVYDWNVRSLKREGELQVSGVVFNQAVYTPDVKLIYAIGSDGVLREISDGHIFREFSTKIPLTNIIVSRNGKMSFATTSHFALRALKYPFPQDIPYEYNEYVFHSSAISRIRMAYDDQFLFTCGEDGCLWVYRLQEREARGIKREKDWGFSDEILVTKSDLKENHTLQLELKRRVEDLKAENETQLRMKDLHYSNRLAELDEKYTHEVNSLKRTNQTLRGEQETNALRYAEVAAQTRASNQNEIKELQKNFQFKLEDVTDKHQRLQRRSEQLKEQWQIQMRDMEVAHEQRMKEIKEYFEGKIKEKMDFMANLKSQAASDFTNYNTNLADISTDTDTEIVNLSYSYEQKLKIERDALASIKAENASMHSKFDALTREVDEQKAEMAKRFAEERRLQMIIRNLEKDVLGVKREIQERDDTIQDKSKRIYDLKKKNQELEKFKFVLDYKIMELRKQIEPREEDIVVLSKQIKEMDNELHGYQKRHDDLDMTLQDLLMRLRATQNEGRADAWRTKEAKASISAIQDDISSMWGCIKNMNELKRNLIQIHRKYSTPTPESVPPPPPQTTLTSLLRPTTPPSPPAPFPTIQEAETAAHRDHLERTIATLNQRLVKEGQKRYSESLKICKENAILLGEINLLRKDIQSSTNRTAHLTELIQKPKRSLSKSEHALVYPNEHMLRDSLKGKRRNMTAPGAIRLLKGNVATLAGLPPP